MKASLKILLSEKPNKDGYPVYKILYAASYGSKKKKLFRTHAEHWNSKTKQITPNHPYFDLLIGDLLNVKSNIAEINTGRCSYDEAVQLLFGESKKEYKSFYLAGCGLVDGTTNGKLYQTVLNSFNSVYPNIDIKSITPNHALNYMNISMRNMKPNGVHTYMRTLNAIFNKVALGEANPFKGIRPTKEKTASKHLNDNQLKRLFYTRTIKSKFDGKNTVDSVNYYRYYFMLMFYLGGIDAIDLANLRYDEHVVDGRIQFYRFKGGTNVFVNNKILPEASAILKKFKCYPYLVPIHKYKSQNDFTSNMNDRLNNSIKDLRIGFRVLTKGARYSFINRAQQLLIDERITMEIVGHAQQSTHSIYTNEFPLQVRDKAHAKIIELI